LLVHPAIAELYATALAGSSSGSDDDPECSVELSSAAVEGPELLRRFAAVSDGRGEQGRDHPVAVVLTLCAAAVLAGMGSFTAIAGWVADVPAEVLARLYARPARFPVEDYTVAGAHRRRPRPIAARHVDTGHGRVTTRTIRVLPAPADLPFPHVNQAWLIERYVTDPTGTPLSAVAALGMTSAPVGRAAVHDAGQLDMPVDLLAGLLPRTGRSAPHSAGSTARRQERRGSPCGSARPRQRR